MRNLYLMGTYSVKGLYPLCLQNATFSVIHGFCDNRKGMQRTSHVVGSRINKGTSVSRSATLLKKITAQKDPFLSICGCVRKRKFSISYSFLFSNIRIWNRFRWSNSCYSVIFLGFVSVPHQPFLQRIMGYSAHVTKPTNTEPWVYNLELNVAYSSQLHFSSLQYR